MGKVVSSVVKGVTGAVKAVVQPVYNATLKQIPGVDNALVNLDKSVGKAIPGGWGTIASVAASFIPGAQLAALGMTQTGLATGLGALTGSGVFRKGNQFNLQGALMGGAAAYGLSSLGEYAKAASNPATLPTSTVATAPGAGGSALTGTGAGYVPSDFLSGTSIGANASSGSSALTPTANALANSGSFTPPPLSGSEMFSAPSQFGSLNPVSSSGISPSLAPAGAGTSGAGLGGFTAPPSLLETAGSKIANAADALTTPSNYVDTLKGMGTNIADTGAGIKNLITGVPGASAAAAASGVSPSLAGAAAMYGTAGLAALDEQRNYLDQQLASNNIAQNEYNAQVAEIDRQIGIARETMAANPWNTNPDRSATAGPTAYARAEDQYNLYDKAPSNLYENKPQLSSTFTAAQGGMVPGYFGGGFMQAIANNPSVMDKIISQIEAQKRTVEAQENAAGIKAVSESPWNTSPDRKPQELGSTLMPKNPTEYLQYLEENRNALRKNYAMGGSIDDEYGIDESRGINQGNMQRGFMGGGVPGYAKGGEARERRDFLDMIEADVKSPPAQYVEGMGFVTPPPSVEGRLGANFDALGGNIRAGASGMAMMGPDKRIMATPGMMDIGYKTQVGPGTLDVGIQRAMRAAPGRGRDYAANIGYSMPFAKGGMPPRFLSGGGDGMSDSIPATINGKQEARLADGEFVIPADVVSHLGNGSSKAGAKRLYSMMDKVRTARTGTKKQGKQINPSKYLPA